MANGSIDHKRWQFARRIRLTGASSEEDIKEVKKFVDDTGHIGLFHHRGQIEYVRVEVNPGYEQNVEYVLLVEGFNEIYVGDSSSITLVQLIATTTMISFYKGRQ